MTVSTNISIPMSYTAPLPLPSLRKGGKSESLGRLFREHADLWKKETQHWSSVTKMTNHPSYRRIMGMGPDVLPLLFRELRECPDHWFVALNAITGDDPTPTSGTFQQAVDAWLSWGIQHGYLE